MVYNDALDRVYMWGGWQGTAYGEQDQASWDRQVWVYDYNADTWTALEIAGGPEMALDGAQAVHHPGSGRMILFGGLDVNPQEPNGKTWAYRYEDNTWIEIVSDDSPSPRGYHTMVYDSAADKIVLFGGVTGTWEMMLPFTQFSNELWFFDPKTDQWSQVTPAP